MAYTVEPGGDRSPLAGELQRVFRSEWAKAREGLEAGLQEQLRRHELLLRRQQQLLEGLLLQQGATLQQAAMPHEASETGSEEPEPRERHRRLSSIEKALGLEPMDEDGNGQMAAKKCDWSSSFGLTPRSGSPIGKDEKLSTNGSRGSYGGSHGRKGSTSALHVDLMQMDLEHAGHLRRLAYRRCSRYMERWMSLEEPEREGQLARAVLSKWFEAICAAVIVANGLLTVHAANYEVEHPFDRPTTWMFVGEIAFLLFYCFELILKLLVHKVFFFCNSDWAWNILDFGLVTVSMYDTAWSVATLRSTTANVTFMRAMRILRMTRILRMVRVMRFFAELRLILNSLLGSVTSLFWSILMLALIFNIFALIFVQGAASHIKENWDDISDADRTAILATIGRVEDAMLTLFMATTGGDDWKAFYGPILQTGVMNGLLFLFFIAFIQIALMNILTGIFVESAMKLAQPDRDTLALERRKLEIAEADELRRLCRDMDAHNTGRISEQQFARKLKSGKVRARLGVLGLDIRDAEAFFGMLAHLNQEEDEMEIESFVQGCMRLKGGATRLDMQTLASGGGMLNASQSRSHNLFLRRVDRVLDCLQAASPPAARGHLV